MAAAVRPVLRTIEDLAPEHISILQHYYQVSHDLTLTGQAFGVSDSAVAYLRDSPAGQDMGLRMIGGNRNAINLTVAHLIMSKLATVATKIPLDLLVKVYAATLPKETPLSEVDEKVALARRLAKENNLSAEATERLAYFASTGQ